TAILRVEDRHPRRSAVGGRASLGRRGQAERQRHDQTQWTQWTQREIPHGIFHLRVFFVLCVETGNIARYFRRSRVIAPYPTIGFARSWVSETVPPVISPAAFFTASSFGITKPVYDGSCS